MIKNYIKTAFRTLMKNKGFTAINILGLALGLAACLLIVFYVVDELSYDRYNTNANRIYRVNEDLKLGDNKVQYAVAMPPLAQTLIKDFPDVENAVRIKKASISVKKGNEYLIENNAIFADPSLFDVFTLPLIYGNKVSVLTQPNTVVISASTAIKYFNRLNVVGQTLILPNYATLKITGVIKDMPRQSHFKADFIMAMISWADSRTNEWLRSDYNTYVLLRKGANYKDLEAQFPALLRKFSGAQMQKAVGTDMDGFEKKGSYFRLNLMPLTDIHLRSNMTGELGVNSTPQYVYIFSAIALFILLIACVNFMNLSTARSSNRAREVGVRKVLGSARKHLMAQFLIESVFVTLAAAVIAVITVGMLLPAFNNLAGKNITINTATLIWLAPALLAAIVVIGCLAGAYPAMFLSAFQPIDVLKGKLVNGFKGGRLRSFLVVFQFAISIFLIVGTLVIYNQLQYIQNRDVGYNRNHVLIIQNAFALRNQAKIFKQEIKQLPGVVNVTLTGFLPTSSNRNTAIFCKDATKDPKKTIFPQTWQVDDDYIKTLDMKIIAGRSFSAQMPTDSAGVIINETAAKFLGFTNAVNKILYRSDNDAPLKSYNIIGVVKDFNFNSLRENVTPVVMLLGTDNGNLGIRINTTNLSSLLAQIENKWKAIAPATRLQYSFMDADFEATYRTEQRMEQLFIIFTSLAIIIACLGLFGLSAYAAEQRNKEISIRKVLGASVSTIVGMLSTDFIKLVLIAIVIALPVAWYVMQKWLQDFAYRVNIQWWILAIAGLAAILIAFITIGFQSVRAALANPVKSLRSE
ncbi:MAG: yknZ 4 [Mucilaginibacter sp.]|nr:yknZ 4 [Mucilaginibacter sp.]